MRTEIVAGGCSRGLCVSGHVDEVVIITSRPRWKAQENLIFPEERTTTGRRDREWFGSIRASPTRE